MYEPSISQWKILRFEETFVRQNITFSCKNSPAHQNADGTTSVYVKLLSNDNEELDTEGRSENRIKVLRDECYLKDDQWRKAIFEFSSSKLDKLPIRDIAVAGSTNGNEYFSIQLGSVCFS